MGMTELASSSFGQTFQVTPIQMITAVSSAVNGGNLVKPYVVDRILDRNGNVIKSNATTPKRQAISKETSDTVRYLMEQVVDTVAEQGLTVSATEQLICEILTKSQDKGKKGKKVMVFKDIRIFINTLNHAVTTMRKSGISAKATKNETDTYIEYTVKIDKPVNQP